MSSNKQNTGLGNGSQRFRIKPSNSPSNGVFGHQGNPVLTFEMPNSNLLLDPSSVRLVGKFRLKSGTWDSEIGDQLRFDQYLGVNSVFENLTWSSKMSRLVIEKINNYPKLINSIRPALSSSENFQSNLMCQDIATQNLDFQPLEFNSQLDSGIDSSTMIYTGLTMASGSRLPLMKLGGLMLSVDLAPNEAVLTRVTSSGNEQDQSPQYELFDLSLTGEYYVPTPEQASMLVDMKEGTLEMNSFTSLFSILQSSSHNSVFNLGLRELISCFFSFVPAGYINNYNYNQYQNMRITETNQSNQIVKMNFLKNGSQNPFMFDLDIIASSNENQLQKYYLMSLKKLKELTKTSIGSDINDPRISIGSSSFLQTSENQINVLNKENITYGIPYDLLGDLTGSDFSNQPLTIQIDSNLSDSTPNAVYLFTLSKTTIVYNEDSIRIIN